MVADKTPSNPTVLHYLFQYSLPIFGKHFQGQYSEVAGPTTPISRTNLQYYMAKEHHEFKVGNRSRMAHVYSAESLTSPQDTIGTSQSPEAICDVATALRDKNQIQITINYYIISIVYIIKLNIT